MRRFTTAGDQGRSGEDRGASRFTTEGCKRGRAWRLGCLGTLGMALLATAGCVSAPRPVPQGGQNIATVEALGVVLTVPRLDHGAYPEDVLEIASAVYVMVENKGSYEVAVNLEDFNLSANGGLRYSPVPAQQLALRPGKVERPSTSLATAADHAREAETEASGWLAPGWSQSLLAGPVMGGGGRGFGGGGGGRGFVGAPAPAGGAFRGGIPASPGRGFGGGYVGPRGGAIGPRGGYGGYGYGGARPWGGPGYRPWGYGLGGGYYGYGPYWGLGPSWGSPYYYDPYYHTWLGPGGNWGMRAYAWSREDAQRLALQPGKLAPGSRTAGFIYFPKDPRGEQQEGSAVSLRWTVREAQSKSPLAELEIPLTISDQ